MSLKPIKVWGTFGPNPPKVSMVLETLGVPYESIVINEFSSLKSPEYLAINPNGRMPAIYDPNTDFTLWESGAIIEYLIETYDKEGKLSFKSGTKESFQAKQWLFYQVSGQGPYYGQAIWFKVHHQEKVPSAVERYVNEIKRVTGVVEAHLKAQKEQDASGDGPWLVGNRFSYADLAWVTWQTIVTGALKDEGFDADAFPEVKGWVERIGQQSGVKTVLDKGLIPKGH